MSQTILQYSNTASMVEVHNDFEMGAIGMNPGPRDLSAGSNSIGYSLDTAKYGEWSKTNAVL